MLIDPSPLSPDALYKLLTGAVVPRPIAWVTSMSAQGVLNLAPFSAFTFVSNKPPMLGINVGRKAGVMKDTGNNIQASGEYVVHIPDDTMIDAVHRSSIEFPPDVSEVDVLGLATVASTRVRVPRLAIAPIAMECRLHGATAYGSTGSLFIVGEVLAFHVRDGLAAEGKIDTTLLRPVCRIGGPNYASLGEITRLSPVAQSGKTVLADAPAGGPADSGKIASCNSNTSGSST
ncbi:MAG: flavin reductase family protein [Lautropia sp.]